ncbi:hypothetical protein ACTXKB_13075 [Psychrobacter aquimaris]|uniref:hypothetical protein n=1 Tax=Psychrobacter aquimaris TaxID=292733 RepID=UPI003FCF636E
MSNQNKPGKVIGRFTIGFDDETKASIADLKNKLDAVPLRFGFGNVMPVGGLLAAMQDTAANDAPQPALKQMGQWVFEGQDEKWVSAHVDGNGVGYFCSLNKIKLVPKKKHWGTSYGDIGFYTQRIGEDFDATNWENSAINRETVNDVDYLSCVAPKTHGMATFIAIDEYESLSECVPHIDDVVDQPNWLSESVPQITQADMQLIFIKNLSEVLIQRMHSMDRFSEDDYAIGSDNLIAWDILIYEPLGAYAILMRGPDQINVADLLLIREGGSMADAGWNTESEAFAILRTITEAELPAFRDALEACYA